jgi:hypothetical protein
MNRNNFLFLNDNTNKGYDLLKPFRFFSEICSKQNITIGTCEKFSLGEANEVFFIDYPNKNDFVFEYFKGKDALLYLINFESPIIKPQIFKKELHHPFSKIFTCSDDFVTWKTSKCKIINFSSEFNINFNHEKRSKEIVIIDLNKKSNAVNKLYTERLRLIRWFNRYNSKYIDLNGFDWDSNILSADNIFKRVFNKFNGKFRSFSLNLDIFRLRIKRKNQILLKYNFCICLENDGGYNGWIKGKIIDCFFVGTIPIFKGVTNIENYISKGCYIDHDEFPKPEKILDYLISFDEKKINKYRPNIKESLLKNESEKFSLIHFTSILRSEINTIVYDK